MNATSTSQPNPYAPPQAEVRDASDGDAAAELAGRGERLGAAILDSLIGGVLIGLPLFIGMDFDTLAAGDFVSAIGWGGGILAGIGALVLIGITIHLVHKNGQTLGKKIVGIKVVRSDHSRASLGRIFWLRNVVNGIPGAIPYLGNVYNLVDHLLIFGETRQCLHDRIADTLVVKA